METLSEKKKSITDRMVDYRKLRLSNLTDSEYRHLFLLLFWPAFMVLFYYIELAYPVSYYYPVYCPLDDIIPFAEIFVVPYIFWFALVFLMHAYTLLFDVEGFKKMIKFIIFTYSFALAVYLVFPNCQELRPQEFERVNIFTKLVMHVYSSDTNTNVCPSIHVMGSIAVMVATLDSKTIKSIALKAVISVVSVLICMSTVFLKQHSVIDVFAALPVCAAAYFVCYVRQNRKEKRNSAKDVEKTTEM